MICQSICTSVKREPTKFENKNVKTFSNMITSNLCHCKNQFHNWVRLDIRKQEMKNYICHHGELTLVAYCLIGSVQYVNARL